MMMTLAQAYALLPGSALVGDPNSAIERVHTDTRTLHPGDMFVALKGERFDAHDFLAQAGANGAVAALAERGLAEAGVSGLLVPDSLLGLQALARGWRAQFSLPLIAVTGSNGKTTVTQMIAAILRAHAGDQAFATEGNLNNHIGVPLTLLKLRASHRAAVVELGMNHPGEIALLAGMAAPTIGLVNNAQREHQEFMASVEAVARENGSVISALPQDGIAVFPSDEDQATVWRELAGSRKSLTFALRGPADVTCDSVWAPEGLWSVQLRTAQGQATLKLRLAGEHNVKNALAATACALAANVPLAAVVRGLEAFEPVKGRSQVKPLVLHGNAVTLIDDSYNANPDSVRAAIDVLAALPGPRWLVLGDMGEVGERGPEFHAEVGAYAQQRGIDALWCAGMLTRHATAAYGGRARHFNEVGELMAALSTSVPACSSVLVKGSRFMRMEQVVQALQSQEKNNAA